MTDKISQEQSQKQLNALEREHDAIKKQRDLLRVFRYYIDELTKQKDLVAEIKSISSGMDDGRLDEVKKIVASIHEQTTIREVDRALEKINASCSKLEVDFENGEKAAYENVASLKDFLASKMNFGEIYEISSRSKWLPYYTCDAKNVYDERAKILGALQNEFKLVDDLIKEYPDEEERMYVFSIEGITCIFRISSSPKSAESIIIRIYVCGKREQSIVANRIESSSALSSLLKDVEEKKRPFATSYARPPEHISHFEFEIATILHRYTRSTDPFSYN